MTNETRCYKAVDITELESWTRVGWQLHEIRHECRIIDRRSSGQNHFVNHYDQNHKEVPLPHGDVLVFIVWKAIDQVVNEETLRAQLVEANQTIAAASKTYAALDVTVKKLQADIEVEMQQRRGADVEAKKQMDQRYKLEGDLAKVRRAIGDLEWKRIIEGGGT